MSHQAVPSPAAVVRGSFGVEADPRIRLVSRLERSVAAVPLTVITAPIGYGKTALVRRWSAATPRCAVLVELDSDDDIVSFGRSLLDAVARAGAADPPVVAEERRAVAGRDPGVAQRLLAELSRRGDVVVVVDAVDAPRVPGVANELGALLSAEAGGLRIVVTRRSRHPAVLAQMAWSGAVQLIDRDELALTADEASELLHAATGQPLDADDLATLLDRTEGWPVAIGLVAAQASGDRRADSRQDLSTHRVADLLTAAVLSDLSPSIARFLERTSVLAQMNGSLCDAVTGDHNGGLMLRLLERRGAPIRRTDVRGAWYETHPLLREGLRRILRRDHPDLEMPALRGAARWLAAHRRHDEAAAYLLEAEDWSGLVQLADAHGRRMFESGRAGLLVGWLEAIPRGATGGPGVNPTVHVLRLAAAHSMVGSSRRAAQLLDEVHDAPSGEGVGLVADALRAARVYTDGEPELALAAAARVLDGLDRAEPPDVPDVLGMTSPPLLEQMARLSRAEAHWLLGDVARAREEFAGMLAGSTMSYPVWRVNALGSLALLEAWTGRLTSALEHARLALRTAKVLGLGRHVAVAQANLAAGHVMYERDAAASASDLVEDALSVTTMVRRPLPEMLYAVERATLLLASGDPEEALAVIDRSRLAGERPPPPIIADRLRAIEVRAHLDAGRLRRAEAVLAGGRDPQQPSLAAVAVRVALERGDLDEALAALAAWVPPAGDVRNQLEHQLWSAILDTEGGQRARGRRTAQQVLVAAEVEGFTRLFLDAGPHGDKLLRSLRESTTALRRPALAAAATSGPGLSRREIEVLRYLCTPMSNAEIAAHLFISVNTLKTHLRSIYRKLDVPGRPEAAARAREVGLA